MARHCAQGLLGSDLYSFRRVFGADEVGGAGFGSGGFGRRKVVVDNVTVVAPIA